MHCPCSPLVVKKKYGLILEFDSNGKPTGYLMGPYLSGYDVAKRNVLEASRKTLDAAIRLRGWRKENEKPVSAEGYNDYHNALSQFITEMVSENKLTESAAILLKEL